MYFGRGRNKIQEPYTLKEMYEFYIKDKEGQYIIPFTLYKDITIKYLKEVMQRIFEGYIFYIPYRLGRVYINKRKVGLDKRTLTPNWELTNKHGKVVYHLNEHSGGYRYNFKWDKLNCRNKNHKMYRLVFTRDNKRTLAKYIKDKVFDYLEE